jgi:hypothetical protein
METEITPDHEIKANRLKFIIVLVIIVVIGSGCIDSLVKTRAVNNKQILIVEGGEEGTKQEVNDEWEILVEEVPQNRGIDFYKNEGFGITKVTLEYSPASGKGTILFKKIEDDWVNQSRSDYYISGMRLLLKKESGEVYDTGMILFQKDETWEKSISVPKERFVRFKVAEVKISPRN